MSLYNKYFFHNLTEKYITIFGSLFDEIEIKSKNGKSKTIMSIVPLIYSNRDKYIQRLLNDENQEMTNTHIAKLPMIAYSLTDIHHNPERNLARQRKILINTDKASHRVYTPVPYTLTFTVEIIAKTQNELFQIIEQILPAFQPEITLVARVIGNETINIPITYDGIFLSDSYDGDIGNRRIISATLNFNMQVYYFAPIPDKSNLIFSVDIQLLDSENQDIEHKIIDIADNAPDNIIDLFKDKYLGSNVANSLDEQTILQKFEELKQS